MRWPSNLKVAINVSAEQLTDPVRDTHGERTSDDQPDHCGAFRRIAQLRADGAGDRQRNENRSHRYADANRNRRQQDGEERQQRADRAATGPSARLDTC